MNKIYKIILVGTIAIFGAGFLFVLPTNAQPAPLIVEYSTDGGLNWVPLSGPIFNETNFIPGDGVSRLVRVTNNSGQTQRIATEAINENDPDGLASQLNLTIKQGATVIFNNTLAQFFSQGETYLSSLANGAQTQYEFKIAFRTGAGDIYQEKALGFDILVGFEGTEGGLPLPNPGGGTGGGGGGGGGSLPPGLTIFNEASINVTQDSATISWLTTYESTSWVIYALDGESYTFDLTQPNYGYPHSAPTPEDPNKVINHSVTITGLTPGTTYHYRCVSHASLAVSTEHSFTTLTPQQTLSNEELNNGNIEEIEQGGGQDFDQIAGLDATEENAGGQVAGAQTENNNPGGSGSSANDEGGIVDFGLAEIGGLFNLQNFLWVLIIIAAILFILFILSRKKKKKENLPSN